MRADRLFGAAHAHKGELSSPQVFLFALAAAVMVANIYYSQPLLAVIGHAFGVKPTQAGFLVTLTQLGYGLGVLLIVPLGDRLDRRRLASTMLAGCVAALAVTAVSPSFAVFAAVQLFVGMTASATMVVIPYVASHSAEAVRGQRVGTVITGLLLGILLARTVSGFVSDLFGWRWMYALAAILVATLWVVLRRTMQTEETKSGLPYRALMRSLVTLLKNEPELRRRSFYCLLGMGSFSALWTGLTLLLTAEPYNYTPATIGLFGLIGATGAISASFAGRLADRGLVSVMTGAMAIMLALSWVLLAAGKSSLAFLIAGILVLDVVAMGLQVVHQSVLYKLNSESQSRITSIFVTSGFIGMSLGSASVSYAFSEFGWLGVCIVGGSMPAVMVLDWLVGLVTRRT
jgi:predicted MFS family arabinose efflux permease